MKKLYFLMVLLSCFILGAYACSTQHGVPIALHRWLLTSVFGALFLFAYVAESQ